MLHQSPDIEPLQGTDVVGQNYRNTCKQSMPIASWAMHQRTAAHQMRKAYASYRAALDEVEKDKNDIFQKLYYDTKELYKRRLRDVRSDEERTPQRRPQARYGEDSRCLCRRIPLELELEAPNASSGNGPSANSLTQSGKIR